MQGVPAARSWLEIGNALAVGRMKNPSNQKFGQWCTAAGFVFSKTPKTNANIRADALWLASNWDSVSQILGDEIASNPSDIRQLCRDHAFTSNLPEELQSITPEATTVLPRPTLWTYPDLTDTLGLDLHFAAEVNSAVAGMAALALLCISFSKLMGDF